MSEIKTPVLKKLIQKKIILALLGEIGIKIPKVTLLVGN